MLDSTQSEPNLRNPLAETLSTGGLGLALLVQQVQCVNIAVAAKQCGFDAINIDLEHSVISESVAAQISIAAMLAGITPLVRIPTCDGHYASRILDAGACGVVIPNVQTAEEARAMVAACKFAPHGTRSVAGSWPHLGYKSWPAEAVRRAFNAKTTVIVMIECAEAVAQAAAIAAVPGVDVLHVGSTDLCESLGIPGQVDHPALIRCFAQVIAACKAHGKVAGAGGLAGNIAAIRKVVQMGARFVTAGIEWDLMMSAAQQRASALREIRLN